MAYNHSSYQGRVCHTPELRVTPNGTSVSECSIAVSRDIKNQSTGQYITDFIDLVFWKHNAEFFCRYVKKGDMILVEGRTETNTYTDKEGNKRKKVFCNVQHLYFQNNKKSDSNDESASNPYENPTTDFSEIAEEEDGELPF